MLTLSGIAEHQRRSWGIFNFTEDGVIVFFHQPVLSANKTESRRETLLMGKKKREREYTERLKGRNKRNRILIS